MTSSYGSDGEAEGVEVQHKVPWPHSDTEGFTTLKGRLFHRRTSCRGYSQGVANTKKHGGTVHPVRPMTASTAKGLGKAACSYCWG